MLQIDYSHACLTVPKNCIYWLPIQGTAFSVPRASGIGSRLTMSHQRTRSYEEMDRRIIVDGGKRVKHAKHRH